MEGEGCSSELGHLPYVYGELVLGVAHDATGLSCDQLNTLVILVVTLVFSVLYRRLEGAFFRHLSGAALGTLFLYLAYGPVQFGVVMAFILGMYPLIMWVQSPALVYCVSMGFLVVCFAYQAYYHYLSWRMDYSSTLMVLVLRMQTLVYDLRDGQTVLSGRQNEEWASDSVGLKRWKEQHACTQPLGWFEYLSFQTFYLHSICGSSITISDYLKTVKNQYDVDPELLQKHKKDKNRGPLLPPIPYDLVAKKIAEWLMSTTLMLLAMVYFPTDFIFTEEYRGLPLWQRILWWPASQWFASYKYLFAWSILDLSALVSGVAFSGFKDGKHEYKTAINANAFAWTLSTGPKDYTNEWNMTANVWLSRYVFQRIPVPKVLERLFGGASLARIMITRMTAALWHGVYPGTYLFYFITFFLNVHHQNWKAILPDEKTYAQKGGPLHWFWYSFWMFQSWLITFSAVAFFLNWDITQTIPAAAHNYWFPVLYPICSIGVAVLLGSMGCRKKRRPKRSQGKVTPDGGAHNKDAKEE